MDLRDTGTRISIVAFALVLGIVLWPQYQEWSKHHDAEELERDKKAQLAAIGTDATITASLLWSAYKSCRVIGIADMVQCSQHTGPLLQEQVTPPIARMALEQRQTYDTSCQKQYGKEYCDALLNRAFRISQNQDAAKQE